MQYSQQLWSIWRNKYLILTVVDGVFETQEGSCGEIGQICKYLSIVLNGSFVSNVQRLFTPNGPRTKKTEQIESLISLNLNTLIFHGEITLRAQLNGTQFDVVCLNYSWFNMFTKLHHMHHLKSTLEQQRDQRTNNADILREKKWNHQHICLHVLDICFHAVMTLKIEIIIITKNYNKKNWDHL